MLDAPFTVLNNHSFFGNILKANILKWMIKQLLKSPQIEAKNIILHDFHTLLSMMFCLLHVEIKLNYYHTLLVSVIY